MNDLQYVKSSRPLKPLGVTAKSRAKRRRAESGPLAECHRHADLRDGACKVSLLGGCEGPTELMHLRPRTRAQTRGMAPDFRHTKEFTMNGCRLHHRAYDAGTLTLAMFEDLGANGPIRATYQGRVVFIP